MPRNLTQKDGAADEEAEEKQCIICFDAPRSIRFRPCHHSTMCDGCVLKLIAHSENRKLNCPSCCQPIVHLCCEGAGAAEDSPTEPVRQLTYEALSRPNEHTSSNGADRQKVETYRPEPLKPARVSTFDKTDGERTGSNVDGLTVEEFIAAARRSSSNNLAAEEAHAAWQIDVEEISLCEVVHDNNLEEARRLRALGASVTRPDESGMLPLVLACFYGNLEMAKWLRSEGAEIDGMTSEGHSPAHAACSAVSLPLCEWLYSEGVRFDPTSRTPRTGELDVEHLERLGPRLQSAQAQARHGYLELVVDGSHDKDQQELDDEAEDELTDLVGPARDDEGVEDAAQDGAQKAAKARRRERETALEDRKLALCRWLLTHGVRADERPEEGRGGQSPPGSLVRSNDGDQPEPDGSSALLMACAYGHLRVAQLLHAHGAPINALSDGGATPFLTACVNDRVGMLPWLKEAGADLGATGDLAGENGLMIAAREGCIKVVRWLHEEGCLSINSTDKDGRTAAHWAAGAIGEEWRRPDYFKSVYPVIRNQVLEYLHAHGANLGAKDKNGNTPLHLACAGGMLEAAQWLVAHGASPKARNAAGFAPVHLVLLAGSEEDDEDDDEDIDDDSDADSDEDSEEGAAEYLRQALGLSTTPRDDDEWREHLEGVVRGEGRVQQSRMERILDSMGSSQSRVERRRTRRLTQLVRMLAWLCEQPGVEELKSPSPRPRPPRGGRGRRLGGRRGGRGEEVDGNGIHPGCYCDRSGMGPIVGMRYHLRGHDFDLCQAEYDKLSAVEKRRYESIPPPVPIPASCRSLLDFAEAVGRWGAEQPSHSFALSLQMPPPFSSFLRLDTTARRGVVTAVEEGTPIFAALKKAQEAAEALKEAAEVNTRGRHPPQGRARRPERRAHARLHQRLEHERTPQRARDAETRSMSDGIRDVAAFGNTHVGGRHASRALTNLTNLTNSDASRAPTTGAFRSLGAAVMEGTPGRGWDFLADKETCVLRHHETGHAVALFAGSNGWLRFRQGDTAPEMVEWSDGSTDRQQLQPEERRLLGMLMTSPGAHPLSTWLGSTTKFGPWKFMIADGGLVLLQTERGGEASESTRCLTAHGYQLCRNVSPVEGRDEGTAGRHSMHGRRRGRNGHGRQELQERAPARQSGHRTS